MNCPSHYLLYQREEALATASCRCGYATFDVLHRNEVSGRAVAG